MTGKKESKCEFCGNDGAELIENQWLLCDRCVEKYTCEMCGDIDAYGDYYGDRYLCPGCFDIEEIEHGEDE